jgi:hypothetical protein
MEATDAAALEETPALRALTPFQRKFVLAMASSPFDTHASWAAAAGYAPDDAKKRAHELLRHEAVVNAIQETARLMLNGRGAAIATALMLSVAEDKGAKPSLRLKAATELADRAGLHARQELRVEHHDTSIDAIRKNILELAAKHGLNGHELIGRNATIDGEFIDVTPKEAN